MPDPVESKMYCPLCERKTDCLIKEFEGEVWAECRVCEFTVDLDPEEV
jgi:transcription elongation factor Elf1